MFSDFSSPSSDPRVADWFLMDSPFPTLALCLAYLGMCYAGPRMMANREPFQLRPVIIVYNLVMVLVSAYMCYEVVKSIVAQLFFSLENWCGNVFGEPKKLFL